MSVSRFTVLSAESLNPEHPLHDEFTARMDDIWENYSQYPWLVLRNWVHGSRVCDRWCVRPWKSWMACNYGGCASLKLIYAKSGLRWKTCCFHPRCGMHIVDFEYLLRLALHARARRRGSDGPSPFALTGLCRVADVHMIY